MGTYEVVNSFSSKKSDRYLPVAFLYSNLRSFHWKKQSGVKINGLCIGTENIFISPRLFFQDGRVPRGFFAKKESLCIFHTSRYIAYNIRIRLCASFHSTEADFYIKDYEYNL